MISKGNLYLGNHLDYFGTKFRSMDAQVLFRSFRAKIIQSITATTSIAIRVANRLRIKRKIVAIQNSPSLAEGVKGWVIRHCEGESTNRRNQSIPFPSLRGDLSPKQSTQKKEWIATTCFRKSRNDESIADCEIRLCRISQ